MDERELFFLNGLSRELFSLFDFKSLKVSNKQCSCEVYIKKENLNQFNKFDDGLLIALIDTFSSYVVKFLIPKENFQLYLSLSIQMNSYDDIIVLNNEEEGNKIKIVVELLGKFDRDILLGIKVFNHKDKFVKYVTHLKRKISEKF